MKTQLKSIKSTYRPSFLFGLRGFFARLMVWQRMSAIYNNGNSPKGTLNDPLAYHNPITRHTDWTF